jgi:hypothetical protein
VKAKAKGESGPAVLPGRSVYRGRLTINVWV